MTKIVNKRAVNLLVDHMKGHELHKPGKKALPRVVPAPDTAARVLNYLDAFGYLSNELAQWKDINLGDIVEALKQFQGFFGLKKTGDVCPKTLRAMQVPRCGCPDIVRARHTGMRGLKELADTNLPRWQKTGVFYTIDQYLPGLSKTDFESIVYNAFQAWCRYGNIDVQPAKGSQQADIVISNGRGQQDNFDGPGGILAWALMPNGTDQQLLMKFDLDETWITDATARGILVANVACHEFGHLLGLDHSRVQGALMAPYYNAVVAVPQQQDDIPRFQVRYGTRQTPTPTPMPTPMPTPTPGNTAQGASGILVVQGQFTATLNGQKVA